MNLITNRCLGAYIYRDILKAQYENPFIWTSVWDNFFNFLFENYDKVNFTNFKACHDSCHEIEKYYILIDEAVRVNYGHVILDSKCKTPTPRDINIYTDDPIKYIQSKYVERLARMTNPPVFIYMDLDFTRNYEIVDIAQKIGRRLGILTVDENFPENEFISKKVVAHQDWTKIEWWPFLYKNYSQDITALLQQLSAP